MKLKKFTKNKKQKGIVIGSIVGILLLIGGITLYRTFAMYKVEKTFDVLNGIVPEFSNGDVTLAFTINGTKPNAVAFPNQNEGFTKKSVRCENDVDADWDDTNWALKVENSNGQSRIKCTIDFYAPTFSTYLKSKVTSVADGGSGLIVQAHEATEQTGTYATTDYRYIGANPNNYVCLEESGQCSEDQLYRIIGIMPTQKEENGDYEDRVKLIKNTDIGESLWSGDESITENDWTKSKLNTDILNKTYWNEITNYQKYIEKAKWYLGNSSGRSSIESIYKEERKNSKYDLSKIGLIYVSEYYYATSIRNDDCLNNSDWERNSECINNDWLLYEKSYYTIVPFGNSLSAVYIANYGKAEATYQAPVNKLRLYIRPSFYLKTNVLFQNGNGTQGNPYRVSINEN